MNYDVNNKEHLRELFNQTYDALIVHARDTFLAELHMMSSEDPRKLPYAERIWHRSHNGYDISIKNDPIFQEISTAFSWGSFNQNAHMHRLSFLFSLDTYPPKVVDKIRNLTDRPFGLAMTVIDGKVSMGFIRLKQEELDSTGYTPSMDVGFVGEDEYSSLILYPKASPAPPSLPYYTPDPKVFDELGRRSAVYYRFYRNIAIQIIDELLYLATPDQ